MYEYIYGSSHQHYSCNHLIIVIVATFYLISLVPVSFLGDLITAVIMSRWFV